MKTRLVAIVATACASLTATGCTAPPSEQTPSPKPSTATTVWKVNAQLIGTPKIANNTIVSYLRRDGKLGVGAWNLADGKQLWSAVAATSGEAPGIELGIETVTVAGRSFVAYLKTQRSGTWRELVVADARTGPNKKHKPIVVWPTTRPGACSDDRAFCLVGYRVEAWTKQVNLRIDPLTDTVSTDRSDGLPPNTRRLGYSIYASDDRPPQGIEQLGSSRDGKSVWQRPYSSVFGEGASSDRGWAWEAEQDNVVVGVGYKEDCRTSTTDGVKTRTCEDTSGQLVGLDNATGATIWSLDRVAGCQGHDPLAASSGDVVLTCRNLVDKAVYRAQGKGWKLQSSTNEQE